MVYSPKSTKPFELSTGLSSDHYGPVMKALSLLVIPLENFDITVLRGRCILDSSGFGRPRFQNLGPWAFCWLASSNNDA